MSSAAFTSSPALSVDTMTSDSTNSDSTSDAYAVYEDRAKNGVFDDISTGFTSMGHRALANAEYNIDIRRKIEGWSGGYSYLDLRSSEEYKAVLFGQVMAASAGTLLSAKGNHYAGRPGDIFLPIGDDSKCKDVIVIGCPTLATPIVEDLFMNQKMGKLPATLLFEAMADRWTQSGVVKEWVRNKKGNNSTVKDLISLHLGPKYANPGTGAEDASKRVKKRELRTAEKAVKKGGAGAKTHVGLVSSGMEGPVVTAGAFYEPRLLPDYGGAYFNLVQNKLRQQDVRDPDDQLIPPWEMHTALRPGTLIMAECTLNAFHIKDKRGDGPDRRIYQVNAQSIRVLDYSKESVVIPTRPVVPTSGSQSDSVSSDASVGSTRPPPSDAFANFQMNKRRRSNPEKTTIVLDASVPAKERPAAKPKTKGRKNAEPSTGDASKADAMEDGPPSN
ncbi:hypothetical protein FPV67DRAFT_1682683 [Lyophyllum atratum]|nr:hypothetical protein FPV67DRAFT_1682683 [Lyophyllum atratum]